MMRWLHSIRTRRGRLNFGELASVRRRFARYLRPHWGLLAVALMASLTAVAAQILAPWPIKVVFDAVLSNAMADTALGQWFAGHAPTTDRALLVICGAILAIALLEALAAYVRDIALASTGQEVVGKIRQSLFRHMQRLSPDVFETRRTGDLLMRLTGDMAMLRQMLVNAWINAGQNALTIIVMLTVMFWINPLLALIAIAAFPVVALATAFFGQRMRQVSKSQREKESLVAAVAHEVIGAMSVVQAFNREQVESRRFSRENRSSIRAGLKGTRLQSRLFLVVSLATAGGLCAVLFVGVRAILAQAMTAGDLLLFVAYVRAVNKPLRKLSSLASQAAKATACGLRIAEILDIVPTITDRDEAVTATDLVGDITLDGVGFTYPDGTPALQDLSCHVAAGEHVAVVGASGAGKSTVMKLLMRFYDPQNGSLRVDGRDIREFSVASLRDQLAIVQQDTVLFGLTVGENIALGHPDATPAEVEKVARDVGADAFIQRLPKGYDTVLSERGTTLSGGQRQRLALARAMIRRTPVLILDEPVAGLDAAVAATVEALWRTREPRQTVLVICHQLANMERYDRVLVLERGRLRAAGPHADLLQHCPEYQRLHTAWSARSESPLSLEADRHAGESHRLAC